MIRFALILGLLFVPTLLMLALNRKRPVKQMVRRTVVVQALVLLAFVLWQPASYCLTWDQGASAFWETLLTWYAGDGILGLVFPAIAAVFSALAIMAAVKLRKREETDYDVIWE